jgi:EAL domain-containing protein (putative c-di-GMP-specific phosphodiesterase class I)
VVAEGVEHLQALQTLRRLGCTVAQGYYFSRPMPVANVVQWIASQDEQRCAAACS